MDTSSVLKKEDGRVKIKKKGQFKKLIEFCVIGKLLENSDIQRFATLYYPSTLSLFELPEEMNIDVPSNFKILNIEKLSRSDVLESLHNFIVIAPGTFKYVVDWSQFLDCLVKMTNEYEIWLATSCLAAAFGLSLAQRRTMQELYLDQKSIGKYLCQFERQKYKLGQCTKKVLRLFVESSGLLLMLKNDISFVCRDLFKHYNVTSSDLEVSTSGLVLVPSTKENLKRLALGIVSEKAVYLKGSVGSGKTTLVEELADMTGMSSSLKKVQLCDHLDSKTLLGMYCCTDVPGEFVWRPGVLTQAVTKGQWILMEDIDSASTDVIATLSSLVEAGHLYVCGHGEIKADKSFRLFVTQRCTDYESMTTNLQFLQKKWTQISVTSLNKEELLSIIMKKFPFLKSIAQDMLKVFIPFSTRKHENEALLSKSNQKLKDISTRDLMKWCFRASKRWHSMDLEQKVKDLYLHAVHLFCSNISNRDERYKLAVFIGFQMNLSEDVSRYYWRDYKPQVRFTEDSLYIGNVVMPRQKMTFKVDRSYDNSFFPTRQALCIMEGVSYCVENKEPVLLVGETGTGKTSVVQYLARSTGHNLTVINMNQQSDSSDLLGGYKPVDPLLSMESLYVTFVETFKSHLSSESNANFLSKLEDMHQKGHWKHVMAYLKNAAKMVIAQLRQRKETKPNVYPQADAHLHIWFDLQKQISDTEEKLRKQQVHALKFIEGSLVQAVMKGNWVLLDEINLATAETLQCLSGLLESERGSVHMFEKGDNEAVSRHERFRLFACMNPSTDVGKKELPVGLRNRFTELFVDELTDKKDLTDLIGAYLKGVSLPSAVGCNRIYSFYINVQSKIQELLDGAGNTPHYSLRTLCRALRVAASNPCGAVLRSLYESFNLSFISHLDDKSQHCVLNIFKSIVFQKVDLKSILKAPMPRPNMKNGEYVCVEGFWIRSASSQPDDQREKYILTRTVKKNMRDLARIVSLSDFPVLIQGETSVGKTSLICELAAYTNNRCVRINNHEHTDVQEYIGTYLTNSRGHLVFVEGILVQAMRKGYWLILDELNLAPTDVLESLNRLLDDNRELFITETQVTVKAHPDFRLFATQNPPGLYGGRKVLSRAFRNRFVELYFSPLPSAELKEILHKRCEVPPSYCEKMVMTMLKLQTLRRGSAAFAGKEGFITLRDLFRWGNRYRLAASEKFPSFYDWLQHLADEGYLLLTAKVRKAEECHQIKAVLESIFQCNVEPSKLFNLDENTSPVTRDILTKLLDSHVLEFSHVVWTYNIRRLAVLVGKAFMFDEPVLVVGETGCGKTTVCQYLAALAKKELHSVNCHMHSESADFLGGLRPVRNPSDREKDGLFKWVDGPLVNALKSGDMFLVDEISLADDSVLERLNPLLEPEREILIPERCASKHVGSDYIVKAKEGFQFIATMNPGGDYGKKELSPALRNRFTEIWSEPCENREDLIQVIKTNFRFNIGFEFTDDVLLKVAAGMIDFIEWLKSALGYRFTYSIRDILTWVNFINTMMNKYKGNSTETDLKVAYISGAYLTFLDGLGLGLGSSEIEFSLDNLRSKAELFLKNYLSITTMDVNVNVIHKDGVFGILPFVIPSKSCVHKDNNSVEDVSLMEVDAVTDQNNETLHDKIHTSSYSANKDCSTSSESLFSFQPKTTCSNLLSVLRGMQLKKPILLEGHPGVGKTKLIEVLALITGHKLVRINVSEQTDISDLFGSDLPVENGQAGQFAWKDGPFLRALKSGHWILLDELNLSSQSVLEGLNACLDHRGEIFIPELGQTFKVNTDTTYIFGTQNPPAEGGARKCLPKSFLNRFTKIYVSSLSCDDYNTILHEKFPELPLDLIHKMTSFNSLLTSEMKHMNCSNVAWELNLRDLIRWCSLVRHCGVTWNGQYSPGNTVHLIYVDRMRFKADKNKVIELYKKVFGSEYPYYGSQNSVHFINDCVRLGNIEFPIKGYVSHIDKDSNLLVLRQQVPALCSLAMCVYKKWHPLLIGGPNTGKSSVVQLLATLTSQELHVFPMNSSVDSLEILGSFEQSDGGCMLITDTHKRLTVILEEYIRLLLIKGRKSNRNAQQAKYCMTLIVSVFGFWKVCSKINISDLSVTETRSISCFQILGLLEEVNTFLELCFQSSVLRSSIPDERKRLSDLKKTIESVVASETRGPAGQFLWIDSVLVKCIIEGKWLLMENVNLCSPAVLDRLNCLLEPDGSLIIGEKGVGLDCEFEEIKPHPNFRIFFTMNPQYGEVSRAMKNRCVEICLLENQTDCPLTTLDVRSVLNHVGVKSMQQQNVLIELHNKMQYSNRPDNLTSHSFQPMFQAGDLISQQMACGEEFSTSCYSVCKDLCVQFYKHEFNKDLLHDFSFATSTESSITNFIHMDLITLSTSTMRENPVFKVIQQELSLFLTVMKHSIVFGKDMNKLYELFDISVNDSIDCDGDIVYNWLIPFCVSFYRNSTSYDLMLRHLYLHSEMNELNITYMENESFRSILIFVYKLCAEFLKIFKDKQQSSVVNNSENNCRFLETTTALESCCYESAKTLYLYLIGGIVYGKYLKNKSQQKSPQTFTVLEMSANKNVIYHSVVTHYSKFRDCFSTCVKKSISAINSPDKSRFIFLLNLSHLRAHFINVGDNILAERRKDNTYEWNLSTLYEVIILYKWIIELTSRGFDRQINSDRLNHAVENLKTLHKSIVGNAGNSSLFSFESSRSLRSSFGSPKPLSNLDIVKFFEKFHSIISSLCVWNNEYSLDKLILNFSSPDFLIKRNQLACLLSGDDFDVQEVTGICDSINSVVDTYRRFELCDESKQNVNLNFTFQVHLWPIYELFVVLMNTFIRRKLAENNAVLITDETESLAAKHFSLENITNNVAQLSSCLPTIPTEMLYTINKIKVLVNNQQMETQLYSRLIWLLHSHRLYSPAVNHQDFYLFWNQESIFDIERVEKEDLYFRKEASALSSPMLTLLVTCIIQPDRNVNSFVPVPTIAAHASRSQQLHCLSSLLWKNMNFIIHNELDYTSNELKYAIATFHRFLALLEHTDYSENLVSDNVVVNFVHTRKNASHAAVLPHTDLIEKLSIYGEHVVLAFQYLLIEAAEAVKMLPQSEKNEKLILAQAGKILLLQGLVQLIIFGDIGMCDEQEEHHLKLKYLEQDLKEITTRSVVENMMSNLSSYPAVEPCFEAQYSMKEILKKAIEESTDKYNKLKQNVPLQRNPQEFRKLSGMCSYQIKGFGKTFLDLYQFLVKVICNLNEDADVDHVKCERDLHTAYMQLDNSISRLKEFVKELNIPSFVMFQDLTEPLKCSTLQVMQGMTFLKEFVKAGDVEFKTRASSCLRNLLQFPFVRYDKSSALYSLKELQYLKLCDFIDESDASRDSNATIRLKMTLMQEIVNEVLICRSTKSEHWLSFLSLLKPIMCWIDSDEQSAAEQNTDDENSLVKFIRRTEDSANEEIPACYLEEDDNQSIKEIPISDTNAARLDIKEVIDKLQVIHKTILLRSTKPIWLHLQLCDDSSVDYITPLLERFKAAKQMIVFDFNDLYGCLDKELVPTLSLLCTITLSAGDGDTHNLHQSKQQQCFNFYKDAREKVAMSIYKPLNDILLHVDVLLKQWPDNPVLLQIVTLANRILKFPITSAPARLLTGLEMLYEKVSEWEVNAYANVSLSEDIETLQNHIITFKNLELEHWKTCLNSVEMRLKDNGRKWWKPLFSLFQFYVEGDSLIEEVLVTLKRFIEESPVGEYEMRLELLLQFHCHYLHESCSTRRDDIIKLLWMLNVYYGQFLESVKTKAAELRKPIEKKLKDFLKIVKKSPKSFFKGSAVAVRKTRRTFHKFAKDYEELLKGCVSHVMTYSDSNMFELLSKYPATIIEESDVIADFQLESDTLLEAQVFEGSELLSNAPMYLRKAAEFSRESARKNDYSKCMTAISELTDSIVIRLEEINSFEENKDVLKKNVVRYRRKFFDDLYRQLHELKFSYRTGLTQSEKLKDQELFFLPPVNIEADSVSGSSTHNLHNAWSGVMNYFPQCLSRFMLLKKTLEKPSKDLNLGHLDRITGYSSHILILMCDLLRNAGESFSDLTKLDNLINKVKSWRTSKENLIYEAKLSHWPEKLKDSVVTGIICLEQLSLMLKTCPSSKYDTSAFSSDSLVNFSAGACAGPIFKAVKDDNVWNDTMQRINASKSLLISVLDNLHICNKVYVKIDECMVTSFKGDLHMRMIEASKFILDVCRQVKALREIHFQDSHQNRDEVNLNPLSRCLIFLEQNLSTVVTEFNAELNLHRKPEEISNDPSLSSEDMAVSIEFNKDVNVLLKKILFIIQEIYKANATAEHDAETSDINLPQMLYSNIASDMTKLNMSKIIKDLEFLVTRVIRHCTEREDTNLPNIITRSLLACCPFLDCFLSFCQHFLVLEVTSLKSSCRLMYAMLGVFLDVSTKGFHIPPELSESMEQDSKDTTSGKGFGDGEGEKDISDQIETEDQLEEAKQKGDTEDETADKPCQEEKEGIETSEPFEGKGQNLGENEEKEEDEDASDDEEMDQEMGHLEDNEGQLDEKLWNDTENDAEEEEDGKGKSGDGKQENAEMGSREMDVDGNEETENDSPEDGSNQKEKKKQDMNDDVQDDQIDPYHGEQQPDVEPEPLDLPDNMDLDDGEGQADGEENDPFDIDSMKEPASPKTDENNPEEKDYMNENNMGNEENNDMDEEETEENGLENNEEKEEAGDASEKTSDKDKLNGMDEGEQPENSETTELPSQDQAESSEPMEKTMGSSDLVNTRSNEEESLQSNEQTSENLNEESENKDQGIGQSQVESGEDGHHQEVKDKHKKGTSDYQSESNVENMKKPPSNNDNKRSLGDTNFPVKKRLRMSYNENEKDYAGDEDEKQENESHEENTTNDMYEHVKEGTDSYDMQTYDTATFEQAKEQELSKDKENKLPESLEDLPDAQMEEEEEEEKKENQDSEKLDTKSIRKDKNTLRKSETVEKNAEAILENNGESENIQTLTVPRGSESFFETMDYDISTSITGFSEDYLAQVRMDQKEKLSTWKPASPDSEAEAMWRNYLCLTSSLAQELCEKLRTVLEPTKASHLQGDYRTGRRINMRKVIPYIASQFRKDKIWLRRTKLSKREYQIILAVDDSASMEDNQLIGMTFESVALISQALNLLEAGSLGVVSFGTSVNLLHPLGNVFTTTSGARVLQGLSFQQRSTQVGRLVEFVNSLFSASREQQCSALFAQLLLIVSDGHNLKSEGTDTVKRAVHRAMEANIFIVFVIIENPKKEESVLDIQTPVFVEKSFEIKSYIEEFPFPFYVILKDINALPHVLGDALRQWFELIVNSR